MKIYNAADSYKQKTLSALKQSDSPERQLKLEHYNIKNQNDKRLQEYDQEHKKNRIQQQED
jgi:hypothetical protein